MSCRFFFPSAPDDRAGVPSYDQSHNFGGLACPGDFHIGEERSLSPIRNGLKLQKSPLFDVQLESRGKKETRESLFTYVVVCEDLVSEMLSDA